MYAPSALERFYDRVHARIPQTKNGGAVGDARHVRGGGYHISPKLLHANGMDQDYSLQATRDQRPTSDDRVSAQDITFTSATVFHAACRNFLALCRKGGLKGSALREWFGSTDGVNVIGYSPYRGHDVTSSDVSHRWHGHFSIFRDSNEADDLLAFIADAFCGHLDPTPQPPVVVKPTPVVTEEVYHLAYPQDRVVYLSKLHPGQKNSDSVLRIQQAINRLTLAGERDLVYTGDYDAATVREVKLFQAQLCNDPADGELGPLQTRYLLDCAGKGFASLEVKAKP